MPSATESGPRLTAGALTTLSPAGVGSAAVADDGGVAYSTTAGVFLAEAAGVPVRPVAAAGEEPYRSFGAVDLADGGRLLFHARLGQGGEGLFLRTPDGIRPVAVSGDPSPAGAAYVSFAQPSIAAAGGDDHAVAFRAVLADGRVCAVQRAGSRPALITLASGQSFPDLGTVVDLSLSRQGHALCAVVRMTGPDTAVIVNGGTVAAGDLLREGTGAVARILDPPAISAQLGFVTVERDDGGTALCTRPPGVVDPEVLLGTGDPVPGMDSGTISRIGPPVASNCATLRIPFGVAAPVRCSDGRHAVWLGVFTGQLPLTGLAAVPVVAGDRTDDGEVLDGPLTPVSLSNTGTLLLRDRHRLYRLDDLFTD